MRIAIVGCGAMGSIYAGLLASDGNDVLAVDHDENHIRAINELGLRISGASGDRTVPLRAFTQTPNETVDLLIIAVKATHVGAAAESSQKLLAPDTLVLTIQNGLGSAGVVSETLGTERLILGVAQGFGASLPGPGHTHHNDMKAIRMGSYAELAHDSVEKVAAVWKSAGFEAAAVENIAAIQWEKLICNVAYSAVCALTGKTVGEVRDDPDLGPVSRAAATEAWNVARARGVEIAVDDPILHVREFAARMPNAKPSVLLDIEAGRMSEIGVINGAIPREAAKANTTAPVNEALTGLVKALEQRTLHQRVGPKPRQPK